jgi:hypothetical protein
MRNETSDVRSTLISHFSLLASHEVHLIEGLEIFPGLWVLQNRDTGRNVGAILGKDSQATTLINPGTDQVERDALEKFLTDMNSQVANLFFTAEPEQGELALWPDAAFITPTTIGGEIDLLTLSPGWEPVILSPGAYLGLYNRKERTLFCGEMLRSGLIPELNRGAQNYLDALDRLEALDARLALPISGPEARGTRDIKARIEHDKSYTLSLLRHVVTSRASNAPLDRVLQVAAQVYEDYPHLEAHLRNIRYAWEEMG